MSFIYNCNHFYLFVVRLFCLLINYLVLHGEGIALISFLVRFYDVVDFFFIIIIISLDTSPPSINASVTTDSKRTSAGVLIDTHTHRTLSTDTHTQVQSSSRVTRLHTQTSTPVAYTHDHKSTGSTLTHPHTSIPEISTHDQTYTDSTLTHPRTSIPVISTQDLTSITPTSASTVNISTVNTSTPVSISHPAERTNMTDKQNKYVYYFLSLLAIPIVILAFIINCKKRKTVLIA